MTESANFTTRQFIENFNVSAAVAPEGIGLRFKKPDNTVVAVTYVATATTGEIKANNGDPVLGFWVVDQFGVIQNTAIQFAIVFGG